jgi:hypothetical protein
MGLAMSLDATTGSLAQEIAEARRALIAQAKTDPARRWPAWLLKSQARNGWSDGAMNLALNRLIEDGTFSVVGDAVLLTG